MSTAKAAFFIVKNRQIAHEGRMIFDYKILFAAFAILLTIIGYIPYIRGMMNGSNKPHIFTWVIWVIVSGIAFVAQLHDHGGPGAWVTGFICFMCLMTSLLA